MGHLVDKLREYLATATPEQLHSDRELLKEWADIGPEALAFVKESRSMQVPWLSAPDNIEFNFSSQTTSPEFALDLLFDLAA